MKTFVGVDYHKKFSYGTIMTETGEIIKQARFANHSNSVASFLRDHGGSLGGCVAAGYGGAIQADYGLSAFVDAGGEAEGPGRRCIS